MKFSGNNEFVFPAINKLGHLHENSIGKATARGFRGTFKTIYTLNSTALLKLGIGEKMVENCLVRKEPNQIKYVCERQTTTIEQKSIVTMVWRLSK